MNCCPLNHILLSQINIDDLLAMAMDYFETEHRLDPEDAFLYLPLLVPSSSSSQEGEDGGEAQSTTLRPRSPEQLQALSALSSSLKSAHSLSPSVSSMRKVRIVPRSSDVLV